MNSPHAIELTEYTKHQRTLKLTDSLELQYDHLIHLPPEVRDQLLHHVRDWGTPDEQLELVTALREAHGPLLFLLDYQANAYIQQESYDQALDVIERRQRRSTTVASQALEAIALLSAGYDQHAQDVVDDISQAYPRNATAIQSAAIVYSGLGRFDHAKALLETYLTHRPTDLNATLLMARLAHQAEDQELVTEYVQRLGAGISPTISIAELRQMGLLFESSENLQSANAVQLELKRRKQQQSEQLRTALGPFVGVRDNGEGSDARVDSAALYRHLTGPESIHVDRKEVRKIQLEAVRHFGFMKLRAGQTETIAAILRGESILAVMPTGAGKSLCYQLPALALPRATLVISPLIALMKDQVESLPAAARNQATFINSTLEESELTERMQGIANGKYKLIYAAPERLRQRSFLRALRSAGLDLFVVDEAHCVSLWGHDFRPDYLFIQAARLELGNPTALAMTATAPPAVRDEIVDYIQVGQDDAQDEESDSVQAGAKQASSGRPTVMALDIFRDNLHLSSLRFHSDDEKMAALLKFVSEQEGSGIVYVNSRAKSEGLAHALRSAGVVAEAYHAGLSDRGAVQDRFMTDQTRVVVATVAFGMGIDKADIRFIVHFHPSRSLAAYYQEVGRAGRDGVPSEGVLFYSNNDWANLRRWAKSDIFTVEFLEKVYAAIAMQLGVKQEQTISEQDVPVGSGANGQSQSNSEPDAKGQSRFENSDLESGLELLVHGFSLDQLDLREPVVGPVDPRRLQQVVSTDETTMRVAVSTLERADLLSRDFDMPRELEIRLPRKLPASVRKNEQLVHLLKGLALKPGQSANFQTSDLAEFMGWEIYETERHLLDWQAEGYMEVKGSRRVMVIELTPQTHFNSAVSIRERLERLLAQSAAMGQRRIDDIVGYATAETCRHGYISAHFGSPPRLKCDVCDNCTGKKPDIPVPSESVVPLPDDADIEPMILDCLISLPKPVGRSGLARILTGSLRSPVPPNQARHHGRLKGLGEGMIMNYIDSLMEDNRLRQYERQGYPVLSATVRGRAQAEVWLEENPELAQFGDALPSSDEERDEEGLPAEGDKYTALQKALWLWRRRTAAQMGQPPYVIMSNELMLRVAEMRPQSLEELGTLPGMGAQRLEGYGPQILDLVNLNPANDGDDKLLNAQRTAQTETANKIQQKMQANSAAVSPRAERRIYMKMQEIRQKRAVTQGSKPYHVASNNILKEIARTGPKSIDALNKIVGFANSGLSEEAEQIVEIVSVELEKEAG
ncbi:RecQ family ATP-dependent DNA helicase [Chloroflexi bacterium TSY]|nr:RecQ family ATP-dependent DNA helicase [Chloroflexi bacterium TSY]